MNEQKSKANHVVTPEELKKVCQIPRVMARKYGAFDPEEIESLANLELAKAMKSYDPTRGMSMSSFCYGLVLSRIKAYTQTAGNKNRLRTISLNAKLQETEEDCPSHIDVVEDTKLLPQSEMLSSKELADTLLSTLKGTNKRIVILHCNGLNYKEIAEKVGLTALGVRDRWYSAIALLKKRSDRIERQSNRNIVNNIGKWHRENPEESLRHKRRLAAKGRRIQAKMLKRKKRVLGWAKYPLALCKVLNLLCDGKQRTVKEIMSETGYSQGAVRLALFRGRSNKLIGISQKKGYGTVGTYAITQKALDERHIKSKKGEPK